MPGKIKALYRVVEKTAMKQSIERKNQKNFFVVELLELENEA